MAVFKDLMSAIFNEEVDDDELEEIEELDEEEEVVEEEPVQTKAETRVVEPAQEEDLYFHPTPTPIQVEEQPEKKSSIFVDFDDDSAQSRPKKKKKYKAPVRMPQDPYDYTPIISPIFGNTEEDKKDFGKVHNAIDLKKPLEEEAFTSIISPMYGKNLPVSKPSIPTMNVDVNLTLDDMLEEEKEEVVAQGSLFTE